MELLYQVKPDNLKSDCEEYLSGSKRIKLLPKRCPIISVSSKNLIAFSSNVDLLNCKRTAAGNSNPQNGQSSGNGNGGILGNTGSSTSLNLNNSPWGSPFAVQSTEISGAHIYVADLNTPWEYNFVKNSSAQISYMQWDHTGARLLVGSEDGLVEIYGMTENLLNKWRVIYSASFPGEPILTACWLGMPRKVQVVIDKIDSLIYSEKYHSSLLPNSKGFGGKSMDGCLVITSTGLVGGVVHCPFEEPCKAITAKEKISALRNLIVCADIAYSKKGDIVVVSCGDNLKHPILVNKIEMNLIGFREKAQLNVTPAQSLFLPAAFQEYSVSSVKFVSKVTSDALMISLINHATNSTVVCLFELTQETVQLKPRFQTPSSDKLINYKWQLTAQLQFNAAVLDICSLPVQIATTAYACSNGANATSPVLLQNHLQNLNPQTNSILTSLVALSLSNGSIVLAKADNLQQIGSFNGSSNNQGGMNFPIKREREEFDELKSGSKSCSNSSLATGENFVALQFSWSGSVLVALTANCHLNVYKMHPNIDNSNASMLIELSMMGGIDPWDIMMCLKQNQIENITDRLSETFARQPPAVQTHFNARILTIKSALYRLACGGAARTNDQTTLLTLHLVSGALKSLLRPSDLSSADKGPAESLSSLLSSKGEQLSDVDKVLVHLVPKEYTVEPSTLQSLQQFLQWCADLALKLLVALPDLRHSRAPLWEVCRDSRAISILRELIVLMRIWGLIRPSCLPSFRKTSENLDVLPLLFRLLTRLSVAPHDPDESLIDERMMMGINPEKQHKTPSMNTNAYWIGGVCLAFVGGVIILLGVKYLLGWRKIEKDELKKKKKDNPGSGVDGRAGHSHSNNLYPNLSSRESSLPGEYVPFTVVTEIQPKGSLEALEDVSKRSNNSVGTVNVFQQQQGQGSSGTTSSGDSETDNDNNEKPIPLGVTSTTTPTTPHPPLPPRRVSKMDSFPYEEYGIPEEEREKVQTRVNDLHTFNHFLHLTQIDPDLMREESIEEELEEYGIPKEEREKLEARVNDRHTYHEFLQLDQIDPDSMREKSDKEVK